MKALVVACCSLKGKEILHCLLFKYTWEGPTHPLYFAAVIGGEVLMISKKPLLLGHMLGAERGMPARTELVFFKDLAIVSGLPGECSLILKRNDLQNYLQSPS